MEITATIVADLNATAEPTKTAAFKAVYQAYFKPILRFALNMTQSKEASEEIVHDAFLSVWQQAVFNDAKHVKAHLYVVTRFLSANYLKKESKRDRREKLFVEQPNSPLTVFNDPQVASMIDEMEAALAALSPVHQHIFRLSYKEGYKANEAAKILNMNLGSFGNQKARILQFLKSKKRAFGTGHLLLLLISRLL
jgi:RNA polymerase sigma factor (sigma-70 family)